MNSPRFCKDCRHAVSYGKIKPVLRCGISLNLEDPHYLTYGDAESSQVYCMVARTASYSCGQDGTLFEPKPVQSERPSHDLLTKTGSASYRALVDDCAHERFRKL